MISLEEENPRALASRFITYKGRLTQIVLINAVARSIEHERGRDSRHSILVDLNGDHLPGKAAGLPC
jgi:hypothetical protein